jgi:peptidyl-dipeptidase A
MFSLAAQFITSCGGDKSQNTEEVKKMEQEFKEFVKHYESLMPPAYHNMALAYWDASLNSNEENWNKFAKWDMKMNEILSNKEDFAKIEKIYKSGLLQNPVDKRNAYVLYLSYLGKQIDTAKLNKLTLMQSNIENKYSKFRAEVGGKKLTDNDVEKALKTEKNSQKLKAVWEAHKAIGPIVADDLIALVKLRNEVAKELGYNNYHEMSLKLSDQDPEEVSKLFDKLDDLTRDAFAVEKEKMDIILAKQYHIGIDDMMPWHYQNRYFQEAPKVYDVDLDGYYKDVDIEETGKKYYRSLNMPIDEMVAKSDLYPRDNKNQHAYCIDIDRDKKDIRVLCNIEPTEGWMETMLHEFGHAVYQYYVDQNLPWDLKVPAHTFTTEAIAMMFGRFGSKPEWMVENIGLDPKEAARVSDACRSTLRLQQLVFSRWAQVMYRFEKSMYENPDQDLNKLWWDLVEKYQMITKPEGRDMPDWATKIHIATSPCYYHNYLLGELLASQLYYTITDKVLKTDNPDAASFTNHPEVGKFLIEKVFAPANRYYWNDMIEKATGEKLTPKYYAKQFVN